MPKYDPDCKQQLAHFRAHVEYGLAMVTVATHSLTSTGSTDTSNTCAGALTGLCWHNG